jgi:hypothetical protein
VRQRHPVGQCLAKSDFVRLGRTLSGQGSHVEKTLHNYLNLEASLVMYSRAVQDYEMQKKIIYQAKEQPKQLQGRSTLLKINLAMKI